MRTVTVHRSHGGSGTVTSTVGGIACGTACTATVPDGTAMVLTAAPDPSSSFAGWSGTCTGTSPTCTFMVNSDVTVDAAFDVKRYTVTIVPAGAGTGKVTGTPGALSCPGTCSVSVDVGAQITLTATAQGTSRFVGWSVPACIGTAPCTMTINTDQTVTATFVPASCGDHIVQAPEECDDGNTDNTDACTNACQTARCGDGFTWAGHEQCDDGNTVNTDACTNACLSARCGDGIVWSGHEECDDGNTSNSDSCNNSCHCGGVGEPCCATGPKCDVGIGCAANNLCSACPISDSQIETCQSGFPGSRICTDPITSASDIIMGSIAVSISGFNGELTHSATQIGARQIIFSATVNEGDLFSPGKNTTTYNISWCRL